MHPWTWAYGRDEQPTDGRVPASGERLLTDGGQESDGDEADEAGHQADEPAESETAEEEQAEEEQAEDERAADGDSPSDGPRANVEMMDADEAKPAEPKWEKPDIENVDDIPEVEGPKTRPADRSDTDAPSGGKSGGIDGEMPDGTPGGISAEGTAPSGGVDDENPTAGMPNTARSPGQTRLKEGSADGYVVALELCAKLPDNIRLPEEAADLVPVALEAELEQSVQQFAGEQFENPSPHVETLDFVEVDEEIWFRLRLGISPEAFVDLDPQEVQDFALQKIEGML